LQCLAVRPRGPLRPGFNHKRFPESAFYGTQEPQKIPRVGVLWHAGSAEDEGPNFKALVEGFSALGYFDGQNIELMHRFGNEIPGQLKSMAAELVSLKVDVLVGVGTVTAAHAKDATTTIPVVLTVAPDPVAARFVNSLAKPGGNVTALTIFAGELAGKRLQVLKDTFPGLSRVGLLVNPESALARLYLDESGAAAAKLELVVQPFEARRDELKLAFDQMVQANIQAVSIMADSLFFQARTPLAKLALARRLPTCVNSKEILEAGALMSYGPDALAVIRRANGV
jgi:putative tryptophan/tyrosine transport system substrate-binding protein